MFDGDPTVLHITCKRYLFSRIYICFALYMKVYVKQKITLTSSNILSFYNYNASFSLE